MEPVCFVQSVFLTDDQSFFFLSLHHIWILEIASPYITHTHIGGKKDTCGSSKSSIIKSDSKIGKYSLTEKNYFLCDHIYPSLLSREIGNFFSFFQNRKLWGRKSRQTDRRANRQTDRHAWNVLLLLLHIFFFISVTLPSEQKRILAIIVERSL